MRIVRRADGGAIAAGDVREDGGRMRCCSRRRRWRREVNARGTFEQMTFLRIVILLLVLSAHVYSQNGTLLRDMLC